MDAFQPEKGLGGISVEVDKLAGWEDATRIFEVKEVRPEMRYGRRFRQSAQLYPGTNYFTPQALTIADSLSRAGPKNRYHVEVPLLYPRSISTVPDFQSTINSLVVNPTTLKRHDWQCLRTASCKLCLLKAKNLQLRPLANAFSASRLQVLPHSYTVQSGVWLDLPFKLQEDCDSGNFGVTLSFCNIESVKVRGCL